MGTADLAKQAVAETAAYFERPVIDITKLINPDLTPSELATFLYEAWRLGLDPASGKQIYAVVYSKDKPTRKMSVQISIDGLRAIAHRTGKFDGVNEIEDGPDETSDGVTHPAWCRATVWRAGCSHPFVAKVRWSERRRKERYGEKAGQLTDFWKEQPYGMLEKAAEAAALRKAFALQIRGDLTQGEEDEGDPEHDEAETVEARVVEPVAATPTPAPPPVPPPLAPPAPAPPSSPVLHTRADIEYLAQQIADYIDDLGLRVELRDRMRHLLYERLDSRKLTSAWSAKVEDYEYLAALRDDVQQLHDRGE